MTEPTALEQITPDMIASFENNLVWKALMEIAQAQITTRTALVLMPASKREDPETPDDYLKGEIGGIELFCRLPMILREELEPEEDDEEEEETPTEPELDLQGGGSQAP